MIQPVDQAMLKAEMETLAKACVVIQASAVDSLVHDLFSTTDWNTIAFMCDDAGRKLYNALLTLHDVYLRLKDMT